MVDFADTSLPMWLSERFQFAACLIKINGYLQEFPRPKGVAAALLMDLLKAFVQSI